MDFEGRILPFDADAACEYPRVAIERRRSGPPVGVMHAQIASIARSRGAAVATRSVSDFDGCGIALINPWEPH